MPLLSTPSLNVLGKLSTKGSSKIGGKFSTKEVKAEVEGGGEEGFI